MWQLRDGRLAGLEAGCFLQADVACLGDAALAFIQRRLPLFDVPWRVREALAASGVSSCKTVKPESIRCVSGPVIMIWCAHQRAAVMAVQSIEQGCVPPCRMPR